MLPTLTLLRNNLLTIALSAALLLALAALGWVWIQRASLQSALDDAQARIGVVVQERDQLRAIVARNQSAVQALRFEQEAVAADYEALRAQIAGADDAESCVDLVNRILE